MARVPRAVRTDPLKKDAMEARAALRKRGCPQAYFSPGGELMARSIDTEGRNRPPHEECYGGEGSATEGGLGYARGMRMVRVARAVGTEGRNRPPHEGYSRDKGRIAEGGLVVHPIGP